MSSNKSKLETKVNNWFYKHTKLHENKSIKQLRNYLKLCNKTKNTIYFSNDLKFDYYDFHVDNVRMENIFKVNWRHIVKLFNKYFPKVKINIYFECHSDIQKQIIRDTNCYDHDIYIVIEDEEGYKYDCVIEYFEKIHNEKIDSDKEIQTIQFVDIYKIYDEKKNYNMYQFMKNTINDLLIMISTASDDYCNLSKVLFFKDCENQTNLKLQTDNFENIVECKKTNKFDFVKFYKKLNPVDSETGEVISIVEFINFLEKEYNIICNLEDNRYGNYELFSNIIIKIDIMKVESVAIKQYKNIFNRAINILFNAQEQIINFIKERNEKKLLIPKFIENFCKYHFKNHIDNKLKMDVSTSLYKYYIKTDEYKMKSIK